MSEHTIQGGAGIPPEIRRMIDASFDGPSGAVDAAHVERLAQDNPAIRAELDATRSMIAGLRRECGTIDVTGAVLSKIDAGSPFVDIERRHRRSRRRTAVCVSVVLVVGGIATLQAVYPELSDFGSGTRPISTLTEAGCRDAVDGAQAVASAVGTITESLVTPVSNKSAASKDLPERGSSVPMRRTSLRLGDTSAYESGLAWRLSAATATPSGGRPAEWIRPCPASMSVAWQAPSCVTVRGGDFPSRGTAWVSGWRQDVPGLPIAEALPKAPGK